MLAAQLQQSDLRAQWSNIAPNLIGAIGQYGSIHYKSGIIWAGEKTLFKSLDTGKTWTLTSLALAGTDRIYDLAFFDNQTGMACVQNEGVYITHDQGNTWQQIIVGTTWVSAAFDGTSKDLLVLQENPSRVGSSRDGGLSWNYSTFDSGFALKVIGMPGGRSYVSNGTFSGRAQLYSSSDYGVTYAPTGGKFDFDSWTFSNDSCDPNKFYVVNEDGFVPTNNLSEIYVSSDAGKTYKVSASASKPVMFFSGSIAVTTSAIYCPTIANGIYRSVDQGVNWKSIGGPYGPIDTRLIAAIDDNLIFAADSLGNIWMTKNSGGDSVKGVGSSFALIARTVRTDLSNGTVEVPIRLPRNGVLPFASFVLHYDSTSLFYLGTYLRSGKRVDNITTAWNGRSYVQIDGTDLPFAGEDTLAYARFRVLIPEFGCSEILFDSITSAYCTHPLYANNATAKVCFHTSSVAPSFDRAEQSSFKLYPNPTLGSLTITSSIAGNSVSKIEVVDISGISRVELQPNFGAAFPITLNVAGLAPGTYFVRVTLGTTVTVLPFARAE
jgi:photosystem II stability/assembly factor-like uncharacterized protein